MQFTPKSTDLELLRAWRAGDEGAGQGLCERYFERISRFFMHKLGEQGPDLVQETFLALLHRRSSIKDETRFRSYIFGIAFNVLKKYLRRHYYASESSMSRSIEDIAPGIETRLIGNEKRRLLAAALRRIPLNEQVLIELLYWEEMSSREVASVLGIPAGTVRYRHHAARQRLDREIRRLSNSPEVARRTIGDLETWAERLRQFARGAAKSTSCASLSSLSRVG